MNQNSGRTFFWITLLIVGGVFAYHLFSQLEEFLATCERGGDFSLLLLNVERASHFDALVGPYSRYKVAHPGPIVFYWYALFELLLRSMATPTGSAMIAQIVLNAIFAVFSCVLMQRSSDKWYSGLLLFSVALGMFHGTKVPFLHYIWNPAVLLFPCIALLVSASVLFTRRSWVVLLYVFSALVMSHHHIAGAMFVSVISIVTIIAVIRRAGWKELVAVPYLTSYLVALLGLLPIIVESLSGPRLGNVGRVWRHALKARDSMPVFDSLEFLSNLVTPVSFSGPVNCGMVLILITIPWLSKLIHFEKALRFILLVSGGVGFLIIRGLHELTYDYLVWFLLGVAALQIWLVATILFRLIRIPEPAPAISTGIVFVFSVRAILPQPVSLGGACEPSGSAAAAWASSHATNGARLELAGRDAWGPGAAIVNNFVRAGLPICVEKKWGFMFGRNLTCGEESEVKQNFNQTVLVAPKGRAEGELIFDCGEYVVLGQQATDR